MRLQLFSPKLLFILFPAISFSFAHAQLATENRSPSFEIRSGLKAAAGYSKLFLSDELRPMTTTSDHYPLKRDFCVKAGAMVSFQAAFMGKFSLVFDPAFIKYSWGNFIKVRDGNVINAIDIDMEAIELPLSLCYSFLRDNHRINPYVRGGLSFAYFVDTEAFFSSRDLNDETNTEHIVTDFDFARYQDALSLCAGVAFDLRIMDFRLELVMEKGDGISRDKFGSAFLKNSGTSSTYLQCAVLF
jgi:hypothetical protein